MNDQEIKDFFYGCSQGWSFWMVNLKADLEHGVVLNELDHPYTETNDCSNWSITDGRIKPAEQSSGKRQNAGVVARIRSDLVVSDHPEFSILSATRSV